MIEEILFQYGAMGATLVYLMYDRQVLLRKLTISLDNVAKAVNNCPNNKGGN